MSSLITLDQQDAHISSDLLERAMLTPTSNHPDMHDTYETLVFRGDEEKLHSFLDICVDSDQLYLRGSGDHTEPTVLSGHVVLQLVEATSIKEITLHFGGKARMPIMSSDA
jgi:arrestin-related trafficking adapter 4/5/7